MKKLMVGVAALASLAIAVPASAERVNDPTGLFSEGGRSGYVETTGDGARACNENSKTPLGDSFTGYAFIDASGNGYQTKPGDSNAAPKPTYGNSNVGAGDYDGEGTDATAPAGETNSNDCP